IRPLNGVPPGPTAAVRLSVPTGIRRVHFFAVRSLRVGLTHRRPLRRPGSLRSIRSVTVAASDRRHLKRAPAGVLRRARAATGVAAPATRNLLGAIATRSSVGASVSPGGGGGWPPPGGSGWPPPAPAGPGTGHVPFTTRRYTWEKS